MRRYVFTRYPKCRQTFSFDLPDSVTSEIDVYNYVQEKMKHIEWSAPEIIQTEEELDELGYYFKVEENG